MTSVPIATFLAGFGVGLAVAAPIGPMGVLCIQRTLAFGLAAGLATGLGAATVHVTFGSIAALGLEATAVTLLGAGTQGLSLLSALLLFWFGVRILNRTTVLDPYLPQSERWLHLYASALLFGLSNPMTVLLFIAVIPALRASTDLQAAPVLVIGVFLGSILWWTILSMATALIRTRLSVGAVALTNRASGLTLVALGTLMLMKAFEQTLP